MHRGHNYGRGGGGWRGNHGRKHGGKGWDSNDNGREESGGRGERPPPGLKGREIGMWFARRSKAKKEQQEKMNRQSVVMDQQKEANIRSLLNDIREGDKVPPQVFRGFDKFENSEDWWDERPGASQSTSAANASCDDVIESWEDIPEETNESNRKWNQNLCQPESSIESKACSSSDFRVKAELAELSSHDDQEKSVSVQNNDSSQALPFASTAACVKTEDEDTDDEELKEEVPQMVALLEYSRAHGDVFYLSEETTADYFLKEEDMSATEEMNRLNKQLSEQAEQRLGDKAYLKMLSFREKLPSYKMREEIVRLVHNNQVVVISGETGCGKTTQVPQFILDDYISRGAGSQCHVICTQPRRISAISVAERVAAERCEKCGGENSSVGYQIRLETCQPRRHGSILFCTTGIVLKFLEGDPLLKRATHIVLDEIHERDLQSDFLMIILKDLLASRPDLKIILMSATLNAEMFSRYFYKSPMINIPGFTFPVQEFLLEDILEIIRYQPDPAKIQQPKKQCRWKDREKADEEAWNYGAWLRNLHGNITIDDVVFVIDCGKIKVKDYQPEKNLSCLESKWVSRANARQRRGRAGRVQPGYCYHLYTELQWMEMADYIPPEILRTRLEELCLQIKLLKLGRIEPFVSKAMQPPSMEALHKAIVNLQELNALDAEENLLPLGKHLARMPLEPHTGKMILFGAMFCCLDPILTVAASLSFKDAFFTPLGKEKEVDSARRELSGGHKSDHIVLINAMKGWERSLSRGTDKNYCWQNFLSSTTLRMLKDMKKQLAELLYDLGFLASRNPKDGQANVHSDNIGLVKAVLCAGLYPNVAKVNKTPRPGAPPYKMVSLHTKESKVTVHPRSINCRETEFPSKWLVYYNILKTTKVFVHDCTMLSPYPLLFFGGHIKIVQDGQHECISVDDWIVFKASRSTAQLVKDLRQQLDRLLEDKIIHPGVTTWSRTEKEGALMHAILELISTEESVGGKDAKYHRKSRLGHNS
ncbi:hypothetical protein C0Q70_03946 [Pomacea canaliculata]|uniref:Helicase ATP-binding domain-containing protein n=1 Tax=Pomacea canaliculata TaxID=400727 RepID=A0A2T7PU47_POMCA|nr:hypothetical protein C0Q70_03946 [Pomacea canaliculata]